MPTFTALTTLPGEADATALGEAMEVLEPAPTGIGVFRLEDGSGLWEVGGYFTDAPDAIALDLLAAAHGARPFAVSELPETDWVAKVRRELSPVPAGRFHVYGSHDADSVPADKVGLLIDAAMAFGTGHHGTTLGCLVAFAALLAEGEAPQRVADIGCGTAVLAMAAAKVLPDSGTVIIASDIDTVAVEVAQANLQANGVGDRVQCVEAAGFDHPDLSAAAPFDLSFANILKGPPIDLSPDLSAALAPGGMAILSVILNSQSDDVVLAYANRGLELRKSSQIGDWTTLVLQRM